MAPLPRALPLLLLLAPAAAIEHPGGWHTRADIARIRAQIASGKEPWASAHAALLNYSAATVATVGYTPSPVATVHRDCCNKHPNNNGNGNFERDGINAYYLMVKWIATSNASYADAAETVIDAWSAELTGFAGHDQMLAAGIYGSHMAQAAELLAFAKPGWPGKARAQQMFREVIHPVCELFCGRTNSGPPLPRPQTCDAGANGPPAPFPPLAYLPHATQPLLVL